MYTGLVVGSVVFLTGARRHRVAAVAQLVERVLGKDEVMGSSPISSSDATDQPGGCCTVFPAVEDASGGGKLIQPLVGP